LSKSGSAERRRRYAQEELIVTRDLDLIVAEERGDKRELPARVGQVGRELGRAGIAAGQRTLNSPHDDPADLSDLWQRDNRV
jgi:hypothetical protein